MNSDLSQSPFSPTKTPKEWEESKAPKVPAKEVLTFKLANFLDPQIEARMLFKNILVGKQQSPFENQ